MILRIWHGRTPRAKADRYEKFLIERAIPDYRATPGNLDVQVLRSDDGEVSHFLTMTRWESEDAIRAFAGADVLKAKYYPEDKDYLLEFEPQVRHYTIVASAPARRKKPPRSRSPTPRPAAARSPRRPRRA